MVQRCCCCGRKHSRGCGVSFFSFPKNEYLRTEWLKACGFDLHPENDTSKLKLCSDHFEKSCFRITRKDGPLILKPDGIPSLLLKKTTKSVSSIKRSVNLLIIPKDHILIPGLSSEINPSVNSVTMQAKTSTERGRKYRERKKLLKALESSADNQHSTTNQIKTPAQRSREYRQRRKNQADDSQQRMPQQSSTKRVREFRERQRQEKGLRPRGGYRQNAGRPRGNRTAADRIRDYRQRQQENRACDLKTNSLSTENVMNDKDCDGNKQKKNKIDTEHYFEEEIKDINDQIICKTNNFEEVMIKEEVYDDFEDRNNHSRIESKTNNFEEVKIKEEPNNDIEDRNKDIDERFKYKTNNLEEIQIKEEFHNNEYVDYLQFQNYLYSFCKIKPENKDEETTALY